MKGDQTPWTAKHKTLANWPRGPKHLRKLGQIWPNVTKSLCHIWPKGVHRLGQIWPRPYKVLKIL